VGPREAPVVALQVGHQALDARQGDLHLEDAEGVDVAATASFTGPSDHGGSPASR
jgi:hypothetical protein